MSGDEILDDIAKPNGSLPIEMPSFFHAMNKLDVKWKPIPILVTAAEPGGLVDNLFFQKTKTEIEGRLTDAMPKMEYI